MCQWCWLRLRYREARDKILFVLPIPFQAEVAAIDRLHQAIRDVVDKPGSPVLAKGLLLEGVGHFEIHLAHLLCGSVSVSCPNHRISAVWDPGLQQPSPTALLTQL